MRRWLIRWGLAMTRWPICLAVALLAGCVSAPEAGDVGKYPPWLISAAEPAAPLVGFAVSRVQWRAGYLKNREEALSKLRARLQPLDILVFSNKQRLSGHTGSGLFGHSAIYLGTAQQLKALGLGSDPAVSAHREDIAEDRLILESAQKHGTDLSTLNYVTDTDRVAVLRPMGLSTAQKRTAIRLAFTKVGGKFDHHYRLDETETLFCTELVNAVLPQLSPPRHQTYGREVILPDDLALMAVHGARLRFVYGVEGGKYGWHETGPAEVKADIEAAGG